MGLFKDIKKGLEHFENYIHDEAEELVDSVEKLPLERATFPNLPAIPISLKDLPDTLLKLNARSTATVQAKTGLSNVYNIKGYKANGYTYLYSADRKTEKTKRNLDLQKEVSGLSSFRFRSFIVPGSLPGSLENRLGKHGYDKEMPHGTDLNNLSLDTPEQFSVSWTTYYNIYNGAQSYLPKWADTLKTPATATAEFWPTIARYGMPYNLLILQKLGTSVIPASKPEAVKAKFAAIWDPTWDQLFADGLLYLIDMSIFETLNPEMVRGAIRFTPATLTLLKQDKNTKVLTPIAIRVSGNNGVGAELFKQSSTFAWIYALQAAKCSITVYGIWLGHVYHWHIVTAALQLTMFTSFYGNKTHAVNQLLSPQSEYLIPFDDALLLLWPSIAPPTSISTAYMFLEFINTYANGRNFYDDDPKVTLAAYGIRKEDFTINSDWDMFPVAGYLLDIWNATETYVKTYVEYFYKSDADVANDNDLQSWVFTSGQPDGGNVKGIGDIKTVAALTAFLTSIVYRLSVHGCSRLNPSANPALTFIANFPPCLQDARIPAPDTALTQADILNYLPKTGTLGEMMTFYNTFGFSAPYETFLPLEGNDAKLFANCPVDAAPNKALIQFRNAVQGFIEKYTASLKLPGSIAEAPQIYQWPLCIET